MKCSINPQEFKGDMGGRKTFNMGKQINERSLKYILCEKFK